MQEDVRTNHYSPIKMLFQIDLPYVDPLVVFNEAELFVDLAYQPGQFVEIAFGEEAEGVNPAQLEAMLEAQADDWAPALAPALVVPAGAAAAAAGPQMQAGNPAPAPDFDQPGWPGDEGAAALIAGLHNPVEGPPVLNMNALGLQPGAFNIPAFLQASDYAPT